MKDEKEIDSERNTNLLPAEEGANILNPEIAAAVQIIRDEIRRNETEGALGVRRTQVLIGEVDDALFSTANAARSSRPAEDDLSPSILVFGARNVELLTRALKETRTIASGVRFLLREAPEELVISHALAAANLSEITDKDELRQSADEVLSVCREVAEERGFAGRLKSK